MQILTVKVKNYRNLDECFFEFNPDFNFIIGDNNVGKSNLLALLETVFGGKGFSEEDFFNTSEKIEVKLGLKLQEGEIGFFGDNFSEDDATVVNFKLTQGIDELYPSLICTDTEEALSLKMLCKVHHINYSTLLNPSQELKIDGRGGASTLIKSVVNRYIEETGNFSVLETEQIEAVKSYINEILSKVHGVREYSLSVNISDKSDQLLSKLVYLENNDGDITDAGSGTKFITMASLNILCKIMDLYNSKGLRFDDQIFTNAEGKKILPIVVTVDEPEVHLNPFTQRTLVKYYEKMLNNKDEDSLALINNLFGIDGLCGQLIIVTHSPDLLIGGYHNIIRMYKRCESTNVVSGKNIRLSKQEEKQLLMNFPELKAAFFSKVVFFVEGETEYGCMPLFSEKIEVDFDDYGICLINAEGEKNIRGMRSLLKQFGLDSVAIYDNDVHKETDDANIFYTDELCFESEIVSVLNHSNRIDIARTWIDEMEPNGQKLILDSDFVKKWYTKNKYDLQNYEAIKVEDIDSEDDELCLRLFPAWLYSRKSILLGRLIGSTLNSELIPQSYKNVILKAKEVALNG